MPTVDLSVGHGVKPDGTYDPGATAEGGHPTEQTEGDIIVSHAAEVLRQHGVDVIDVESYTDDPNYRGSIQRINRPPLPDLAVTIHHDWRGAPRGFFCHWYEGSPARRAADAMFVRAGRAGFPRRSDWHRPRNGLAFLSDTKVPAVLVECDRVGSLNDEELVKMAEAIAAGILDHFGIAYQPAQERQEVDYDVAIIFEADSPDDVAARALQLEHIFKALPVGHSETVGHAILFGAAAQHSDDYDVPTTVLAGANRDKTAEAVVDTTGNGVCAERKHPTVEDLKAGS